jgi:hypothetical protein
VLRLHKIPLPLASAAVSGPIPKHAEALAGKVAEEMHVEVNLKVRARVGEKLVLRPRQDRLHVVLCHELAQRKAKVQLGCVEHVHHRLRVRERREERETRMPLAQAQRDSSTAFSRQDMHSNALKQTQTHARAHVP